MIKMVFGKNYDKTIEVLCERISEIIKTQNKNQNDLLEMVKDNQGVLDDFQKTLINMAKVQKSHKEAIMLLSKK